MPVFRELLFCLVLAFLCCLGCSAEEDSLLSRVSTVMSSLKLFLAAEVVSAALGSLVFFFLQLKGCSLSYFCLLLKVFYS